MREHLRSPMNYVGGKYKLLGKILPLFPKNINTFYDVFCGGANLALNVTAKKVICIDHNKFVIDLYQTLQSTPWDSILSHIESRISQYSLDKENQAGFIQFRSDYNQKKNPLDFYIIICYSFNNQIRFNRKLDFNTPFGKNRSSFNSAMKERLEGFCERIQGMEFRCGSFEDILSIKPDANDLAYFDPPYLISTGSYNDGKRGFDGWFEEDEKNLLDVLTKLDAQGARFALSNVLEHKGSTNKLLVEWSRNFMIHDLNFHYKNSNYRVVEKNQKTREVLITNW